MHHECGYTFIGQTSMYRLTLPEMRVLYGGYCITKQQESDEAKGIDQGDRRRLREFNENL